MSLAICEPLLQPDESQVSQVGIHACLIVETRNHRMLN